MRKTVTAYGKEFIFEVENNIPTLERVRDPLTFEEYNPDKYLNNNLIQEQRSYIFLKAIDN